MVERLDGCSGEMLLAPCARKKKLPKKMTKDYHWIGAEESMACSVIREMNVTALSTCLYLKDELAYAQ